MAAPPRAGYWPTAVDGCSTTTTHSASRSRSTARTSGIALDLAAQLGAVLPVSALAAQLETGLIAGGHADEDMSALARTIRALSGLEG